MGAKSRRDLLALLKGGHTKAEGSGPTAATVAVAELPGENPGLDAARKALKTAIARALRTATAERGLARLFGPKDVVGIKVSCLAGRPLSPRPQLVDALVDLLEAAGAKRGGVVVFERSSRELRRSGFHVGRHRGYLIVGIDNDFDPNLVSWRSIGSLFAKLVTQKCTALISLAVLKDHDLAGVSGCLKNWFGVIHNPNKYHDDNCDPFVADVVSHPHIRNKLKLNIIDAWIGQYDGGPGYHPRGSWRPGLIAVSTDPVAIDSWAWRTVNRKRKEMGLPTLEDAGRPPRHVVTAGKMGLGEYRWDRIREVGP